MPGPDFYMPSNAWRDFSLVDMPFVYGKICPSAPPHPLGQYPAHQIGSSTF